ncbi:MAG TPA: hypothetical protein VEC39_02480 [Vicinamibacterales bacterium]|nr:hypothetical protein [Vicinamibacterales bacterium]
MATRLFGACLAAVLATGCSRGPALSDADAKAIVASHFDSESKVILYFGQLRFIREGVANPLKGTDTLRRYPLYKAFADLGLVFLDGNRDLSQQFTGWNDFFSLTQSGVQRTANVLLPDGAGEGGPSGTLLNSEFKPVSKHDGGYVGISFDVLTYSVDSIVSNQHIRTTTDDYRQIIGTHSIQFDKRIEKAVRELFDDHYGEPRRFRLLVKFDPIMKSWRLEKFDQGNREGDFGTSSVPDTIRALGSD